MICMLQLNIGTPMILGWDIGGVNTKAAALDRGAAGAASYRSRLACRSRSSATRAGSCPCCADWPRRSGPADAHAVTMTAELSQAFRTKREGVGFVLDAVEAAVPGADALGLHGRRPIRPPGEARAMPLAVGASNWMATASLVARTVPTACSSTSARTSTDIIPIVGGPVVAARPHRPRAAAERRAGVHRRAADAGGGAGPRVPLWGGARARRGGRVRPDRRRARVARPARPGRLHRAARPTAGPPTASSPASGWPAWCAATARCSTTRRSTPSPARSSTRSSSAVVDGIEQVRAGHPADARGGDRPRRVHRRGGGARAPGSRCVRLADRLGPAARSRRPPRSRLLLADERRVAHRRQDRRRARRRYRARSTRSAARWRAAGRQRPMLVVPGGGPFADAVREFDRAVGALRRRGALDGDPRDGSVRARAGRADHRRGAASRSRARRPARCATPGVAVLAPSRVDARGRRVAAYVGTSRATASRRSSPARSTPSALILVKPASGGRELLDPYFETARARRLIRHDRRLRSAATS